MRVNWATTMPGTTYDCSLILPTYNRPAVLAETLSRIVALPDRRFEVIVVDNGSADATRDVVRRFRQVRLIELGVNMGAAARNIGAVAANGHLLLMLDDDSWPAPHAVDRAVELFEEHPDLGAAACRVRRVDPPHRHDAGGVPGVFFNCGGFIRSEAFRDAGGFPVDFDYYVEEYDLCCRLWQNGWRVEPRGDLLVWHRRVATNRDNNRMLRLLVRNNLRLWRRYAPEGQMNDLIDVTIERYRRVAQKENALAGYEAGLREGHAEIADSSIRRHPLSNEQYESLMGIDVARAALQNWADNCIVKKVAIWSRGKSGEQLLALLQAASIAVEAVYDDTAGEDVWRGIPLRNAEAFKPDDVDGLVVGSMSPGLAEDLGDDLRVRFAGLPVLSCVPWIEPGVEAFAAAG